MALYHKYRPRDFNEVEGNSATVSSLQSVLKRNPKERPHAFLLTGPSGCGKTTLGRIIAKHVGCAEFDYHEVDGADFRGIDTIREICRNMHWAPMAGESCVWLLDEVHQLTKDGQEALLKALEDTPPHVYFILATTEPEKLKTTLRNRCSHFEVTPLATDEMSDYLSYVVKEEGARVSPSLIDQIARDSQGSCRMALSILDKVIDLPENQQEAAAEQTAAMQNQVIDLCRALMKQEKWASIAKILKGLESEDVEKTRLAVMGYCSSVLLSGKDVAAAYLVMDCFKNPFYNNGRSGLVLAAYEALEAGK